MTSVKITKPSQFDLLVDELKKRPHLANNFKTGLRTYGNEWDEITKKLNLIGPPMRESMEWQRVSGIGFFKMNTLTLFC